jgi:NAD(P)H-flavin reductase
MSRIRSVCECVLNTVLLKIKEFIDRVVILYILMASEITMNEIIKKEVLAEGIKRFVISNSHIAQRAMPGQFVIIRLHETSERIPLTLQDFDRKAGTINIVVQEVGKSTEELGMAVEGDTILDVVGPLGKPTEIENFGTVVCIGGGVGTPEIYPAARALKDAGNHVITIIGARYKTLVIMEDEMKGVSHELHITTDDGSYGVKGFVTDALRTVIEKSKPIARVFAVGPVVMMKAVAEVTRPHGIKTLVSLNPIMLDGTGMCGVCRVEVGGDTKFACVDGPEFDAHEVNFELLVQRLKTYEKQERESHERFKHHCGEKCHG